VSMGDFPDIFSDAVLSILDGVHTAIPGKITKYEAGTKKASVKPLVQHTFPDGTSVPMPVIDGVPVIFPGSTDFVLSFPLKAGDGCLILFSEKALDNWANSAMADSLPGDPRKFAMTDAICIPGLFTFQQPGKIGNGDDVEILYKGAAITITADGDITLNGDSKSFVTHDELSNALSSFLSSLNAHTHTVDTTGTAAPMVPPLTLDISTAKTTTIKTGG
jgi:hypothetical protein